MISTDTGYNFSSFLRNYNSLNINNDKDIDKSKSVFQIDRIGHTTDHKDIVHSIPSVFKDKLIRKIDHKMIPYTNIERVIRESDISNGFLVDPVKINFTDNKFEGQILSVFKYSFTSSSNVNAFRIKSIGSKLSSESEIEVECILSGNLHKGFYYSKDLSKTPKIPSLENIINLNPQIDSITSNIDSNTTNQLPSQLPSQLTSQFNLDSIDFYEIEYEEYNKTENDFKSNWISKIITGYHENKGNIKKLERYCNEKSILYADQINNFIIIRPTADLRFCLTLDEKVELTQDQILKFEFYICPLVWPNNPTLSTLTLEHIEFIKKLKKKVLEFFENKYRVTQEYLSFYIENMSSSKYFRITVSHVDSKYFLSSMYSNHDLDEIIYNIELDPEYYRKCKIITRSKTREYQNYLKKKELLSGESISLILKLHDQNGIVGLSKKSEKYVKNNLNFKFIHNSKLYEIRQKEDFSQTVRDTANLVITGLLSNDSYDNSIYEYYSSNFIFNGLLTVTDLSDSIKSGLRKKVIFRDYPITNILKKILKVENIPNNIYCEDEKLFREFNKLVEIKELTDITIGSDKPNKTYKYKRWGNYGCILTQADEWNLSNSHDLKQMFLKIYPFVIDSLNSIRFLKNIRSLSYDHKELLENIDQWIYSYIKIMYGHEVKFIQSFIKTYTDMKILEINVTHSNVSTNIDFRSTIDLSRVIFNLGLKSTYFQEIPYNHVIYK